MTGEDLKILREKKKLTQKELADLSGIPHGTIGRIEANPSSTIKKYEVVEKLKSVLGENTDNISDNKSAILKESSNDSQEESDTPNQYLIPMYNFPSAASDIEIYNNPEDVKIIGHFNLPGARKDSFALPVYGHSMYPTLENGSWCVLRELYDTQEIVWGEIYYIEWGDYRMFKRLLQDESEDHVILWSDNQLDMVNDRPKYSPVKILKSKIRRLCLLTDIIKKPNY